MKNALISSVLIILLFSCGPSTKITGSWNYESEPVHFKQIAIIGIGKNPDVRKTVEETFEDMLTAKGFNAIGGLEFLPPNASTETLTKEVLIEFLKLNKIDGVISISLLKKEDDRRYVQGVYYYVPQYDVPLTDYYGQMSNYVYAPGYYAGSEHYFLECSLFNFPEGKMLWSAQTLTSPFGSLQTTIDEYAKVVVNDLIKSGILLK
ncbi:MAG: hypothetical protein KKA81_13395 [Bacteroidetes bacterium]|nr:hypothetical protein [Bacteroidota bacterium]